MTVITLNDETTWPKEVVECLNKHRDILHSWEAVHTGIADTADKYDEAHIKIRQSLNPFFLEGYHCTKLTQNEIDEVQSHGMSLQNLETLSTRIDALIKDGLMTPKIGDQLKRENQANDPSRAHMLWFCFFPPLYAGQHGIERFFRSWGGEALYCSHESNRVTGALLRETGIPCIIEASVPIASLPKYCYLTNKIARVYLMNRGLETGESCYFESYSASAIPVYSIRRITRYPELDFVKLTDCESWDPKLPVL